MDKQMVAYDAAAGKYPLDGRGPEKMTLGPQIRAPKSMWYHGLGGPVLTQKRLGGAAAANVGETDTLLFGSGAVMSLYQETAQTLMPVGAATGLDISCDLVNNEALQWVWGDSGDQYSPYAFKIGTHAFYYESDITLPDISGTDFFGIYVRKYEAFNATFTSYTDYAFLGVIANAGLIRSYTDLNSGGSPTSTSTGITWADTERKKLRIEVALTGVVTFSVNGAVLGATSFTFDVDDYVICGGRLLHDTDVANATILNRMSLGLLGETLPILP